MSLDSVQTHHLNDNTPHSTALCAAIQADSAQGGLVNPEVAELQAAQVAAGGAHAEQVSSTYMRAALSILC